MRSRKTTSASLTVWSHVKLFVDGGRERANEALFRCDDMC